MMHHFEMPCMASQDGASQGGGTFTSANLQLLINMLVNMFISNCRFADVNDPLTCEAPSCDVLYGIAYQYFQPLFYTYA